MCWYSRAFEALRLQHRALQLRIQACLMRAYLTAATATFASPLAKRPDCALSQ